MNTLQIEDRIRAATRAAAHTVTPNSIPPLRLPADRLLRARSGSLASVWGRWLAPRKHGKEKHKRLSST